jgi:hypothetical protein
MSAVVDPQNAPGFWSAYFSRCGLEKHEVLILHAPTNLRTDSDRLVLAAAVKS